MDEYISKHEPIEEIKRIYCTSCNSYNGAMCRACEHQDDIDIIEDTKAADVQPIKHGRWTYPYKDKDINQCSECRSYVQDKISNVREMFAYCPFCGARMDGDDE